MYSLFKSQISLFILVPNFYEPLRLKYILKNTAHQLSGTSALILFNLIPLTVH